MPASAAQACCGLVNRMARMPIVIAALTLSSRSSIKITSSAGAPSRSSAWLKQPGSGLPAWKSPAQAAGEILLPAPGSYTTMA
jgi:hypothetical protein